MRRTSTTVVAIVGDQAREHVEALGRAANVVATHPGDDLSPLDRAVSAWRDAEHTHAPYCVHDADPLATVEDAWVRYYDGAGPVGELEVAVAETVARWHARSLELPDYYVLLDPETWSETPRHWYLGVLHRAAPPRVVPTPADVTSTRHALSALATGPWWPDLDRLLDGVERLVPDRV